MVEATRLDSVDRLLRTDEVAAWLAVSKSTLVRWRQSGSGPEVCWLADGVPRYQVRAVRQWLAHRSAGRPAMLGRRSDRADASR